MKTSRGDAEVRRDGVGMVNENAGKTDVFDDSLSESITLV